VVINDALGGYAMANTIANTKDGIRRHNTKVWDDNGHFAVRLYSTVVYDETRDLLVLNNGGFVTPTTTSRIHQALIHRGIKGNVNIKNRKMFFTCESLGTIPFVNGKLELHLVDGQVA
jgi:hypothetical protein